jgi:ubiquinol-cytochrome c reductase iron-sulfur subunit
MMQDGVDKSRRRFLTGATTVVGGAGVAFTAVPFLAYWNPSARTQAAGAPVEADISQLEAGQLINVEWRGKPVWVFRRSEDVVAQLDTINEELADPLSKVDQQPPYAQNLHRSIRPQIGVLVGICTHLGCSPSYRPEPGSMGPDWLGGFFCPCHGSRFDIAGRVYEGVPAPTNLVVPPYWFPDDMRIIVGEHQEGAAS